MAKKKTTQQPKCTNQPENTDILPPEPTADAIAEKLKHLNQILLKETTERRLQVESLSHSKKLLEAELARSRSSLSRAAEEVTQLEIENGVSSVFVATQLGEMGSEMENLVKERDFQVGVLEKKVAELVAELEAQRDALSRSTLESNEVKHDLDLWVREANGLRENLVEMEKRDRNSLEQLGEMTTDNQALTEDKEAGERALEAASRVIDLLEKNLTEKAVVIEDLKMQNEGTQRELRQAEAEKSELLQKAVELEKRVVSLDNVVSSLRNEEALLQSKERELEKRSIEAMEKEKEMVMEINAMLEEKKEKEAYIGGLLGEKSAVMEQLEIMRSESYEKEQRLKALIEGKNDVEQVKASQEHEIDRLRHEASKLMDAVSDLKESCKVQEVKNEQLLSEVRSQQDAFDKVLLERDNLKKTVADESIKVTQLNSEIADWKKKAEESAEGLKQMTVKCDRLQEENIKIESYADSLAKEKDGLEKKLSEAEQCIEGMKIKVESAGTNSERALALLKNTVSLVSQSKCNGNGKEGLDIESTLATDVEPYVAELEAIKKAFGDKDRVVEDLTRKLENLGNLVDETDKKRSLWTLVSSATTILALSVAFVAKGH